MYIRNSIIIRFILIGILLIALLLVGCVRQNAWLIYTVPETSRPTATAEQTFAPTLEPIIVEVEPIQGEDFHTDRKGIPIMDADTHYFSYYISFSDLRIYEEDGFTFMDGVCTNSFDGTLSGEARICFYDKDEKLVGYGMLHTAEGDMALGVGENRIYAEILSEENVQQLFCQIEQVMPFYPV